MRVGRSKGMTMRPTLRLLGATALALVMSVLPVLPAHAVEDDGGGTPDGVTASNLWQPAAAVDGTRVGLRRLTTWGDGFAALGWQQGARWRGEEVTVPVWLSDDGAEWRATGSITLPRSRTRALEIVEFDGKLFIIGTEGRRLVVWRSPDGEWWRRLRGRASFEANPPGTGNRFFTDISDVVAGHGQLVVSGDYWTRDPDPTVEPVIWTTDEGRRWQRTYPTLPPPDNAVWNVAVLPRSFIGIVGTNAPIDCLYGDPANRLLGSDDGREWTRVKGAKPMCGLQDITFDVVSARYYVLANAAVDDATDVVLASEDLRTWEEVYRPPETWAGEGWAPGAMGIESAGGGIVVVGEAEWDDRDGGTVWVATSSDGEEWDLHADWMAEGEGSEIRAWSVGDERVVISLNASTWYADLDDLGIRSVEPLGKREQNRADRASGRINGILADERPDIYVGGAVSSAPGGAPSVYVKGSAPQMLHDLIADSGYPINIVDEQPYNRAELEERADRVHQSLVDAGYPNVATATDIIGGGVIPVWVQQMGDLPADRDGILAFVPEDLRADVDLDVTVAPPRPSAEPGAWGPLAVVYRPQGFGPGVGLGPVTLRISDRCVWYESAKGKYATTLVWEGNHVDWRPGKERIVFTDRKGRTVRLADGDRIEGGGVSVWRPTGEDDSDPPQNDLSLESMTAANEDDWLQEPHRSCPASLFFLTEVSVMDR